MAKGSRFFYGWVIVGISLVSNPLIYGMRHSFSVFFPYILDEFGWNRGSTAIMLSLNILIYGFLAPVAGSLGDRWKPKRVMPIGLTVLGLATVGCGFANRLSHFYLLFGILMPIGTGFCGWPLLGPALANWFVKKRGLVLGLGIMGGGLSFIYGMFAEFTIFILGWRYAYFVLAGILIALILPLYVFFHYRPEDRGMKPYGAAEPLSPKDSISSEVKDDVHRDWTLRQALETSQLWLMVFSYCLYLGIGVYMVLAHQVKFAKDLGYSGMFSASILGLYGIFMSAGQISAFISDWVGRERIITLATIMSIGALVALVSVRDNSQPILLYLYAIGFGYGAGLFSATIYAGTADLFHGRHFGEIAGLLLTGQGIGGAIGPWLGGYIYDVSGSYSIGLFLCMVCFGSACIMVWIAAPRNAILP
jgi:MFS family permease